ncbi:hypothetical protein BZG36_04196 [Bifiguratus adelaidae]|uniref:Rab-GAP TBC domain-containing protein n=1 Tax=Bifiguratus adelaidae TaxID=1938954 RepID=A0A261XW50_9FUNG|nr:hypothetical protein BZG36_04196 [Bifiguratus adelaidae]
MLDSLEPILKQLSLLNTLLRLLDPDVYRLLTDNDVLPYFCLSWIITWCAHDINDFLKVTRLYDFFMTSEPLMPVYFAAAVVIARREMLLKQEPDGAMLHTYLSKFPADLDVEDCIQHAMMMADQYPSRKLQKKAGVGLDTTSTVNTFSKEWKSLDWDAAPDVEEPHRILQLPPEKRRPFRTTLLPFPSSNFQENKTLITMLTVAAGVGTTALFLWSQPMVRSYIESNIGL